MAKIILNRKSEWMNRAKGYKVLINGEEKGSIKHAGSEEYIVDQGLHIIECKINWMKSNKMEVFVNENEVKILLVKNGMKYYWPVYFVFITVLFAGIFFTKKRGFDIPEWFIYGRLILMILAFCYFVYYMSLGRNKYLIIEEDKSSPFV